MNYATIKKCDVANGPRCSRITICKSDVHITAKDALIKKLGIITMEMLLQKKKKMNLWKH